MIEIGTNFTLQALATLQAVKTNEFKSKGLSDLLVCKNLEAFFFHVFELKEILR